MDAITIATPNRPFTYASRGISVTPNPPCVGAPTTIAILLNNPGPTTVTVERITVKIARFGMGLRWEELPPLGPLTLAADPAYIAEIGQEWTPTEGGHRCVRATIAMAGQTQPLTVGCNLHVVESAAEQQSWQVPFRFGNPAHERAPIVLAVNTDGFLHADIVAGHRRLRPDEPMWLEPGEEIDAMLRLRAHTLAAIDTMPTVEASINGQLVDGIAIHLLRPAYRPMLTWDEDAVHTREGVLAR